MDLTLGRRPGTLLVLLSRASGLHTTLERKVDATPVPWPAGTQIELELAGRGVSPETFPFVVSGALASLHLTPDELGAVAYTEARLWLDYGDEVGRFLWLEGTVETGA